MTNFWKNGFRKNNLSRLTFPAQNRWRNVCRYVCMCLFQSKSFLSNLSLFSLFVFVFLFFIVFICLLIFLIFTCYNICVLSNSSIYLFLFYLSFSWFEYLLVFWVFFWLRSKCGEENIAVGCSRPNRSFKNFFLKIISWKCRNE